MRFLIFIAIIIVLSGCQTQDKQLQKHSSLTIVETNSPQDIFPATIESVEEAHIVTQIHDGLLRINSTSDKLEGRLAKRWVVNNAHDKIIFHLHPDVYFHEDTCFGNDNMQKLTADDVKYSLEYIFWHKTKTRKNIGLLDYIKGGGKYYELCKKSKFKPGLLPGILVKDSLTVSIELNRSNPAFIYSLGSPDMVILPKAGLQAYGNDCMVGAGPFRIARFHSGSDTVILERNNKYYLTDSKGKNLPYLKKLTIYYETVPAKSLRMIRNGQADLFLSIQKSHVTNFVEKNIDLFESKPPSLILEQAKGMENSEIYIIRRTQVKNLQYNSMNLLYLDSVKLQAQLTEVSEDNTVVE